MKQLRTICALSALALVSLATPQPSFAVDGQIVVTQAKAMAGGVTPGDAPGFPVSINQSGSYVLSGNLTVPDANTHAIAINADHVTLDLNGFAILGPTDCSGGLHPCANAGTGMGVVTPTVRFNITLRNGTIQGMGGRGVSLWGDSHLVEYLHVRSNGMGGIVVVPSQDLGGSIAQHNTAQRNGSTRGVGPKGGISTEGIRVSVGRASDNVVDVNDVGIRVDIGIISHNVITRSEVGIQVALGDRASYFGNMLDNVQNTAGGVNLGQNLCGPSVCP